ncbi:hypothetical protein SO802_004505 [Lithocarpus litseifolius]|uniref:F-box domain-containing protein n=1 Tax=Lithocarpus litseifolius TaxID=425828 RepID=A0AAW2E8U8_9ROSI
MEQGRERQRIERTERAARRDQTQRKCLSSARQNALTTNTDTDIISTLPDTLLSHILSFLPIRDSVATSILSNRWRSLWTLVPILCLDQREFTNKEEGDQKLRFVDIVFRIWTLRNAISNPTPLRKLCICWHHNCLPFYVDTWLRATNLRDLQQLFLSILTSFKTPFELPCRLYFSTKLVVPKFAGDINLNPPPACALPCLRILGLRGVILANQDSLSTFLTASPVLHYLSLTLFGINLEHLDEFSVTVLVPTLKILYLDWKVRSPTYKFHINTPAFEYFCFTGFLNGDYVLENLHNVVECVLQFEQRTSLRIEDYAKKSWDFMRSLCNVISMELSTITAQILCYDSNHEDGPTFYNLSSLKFFGGISSEWYVWDAVRLLLYWAPKLQILSFEKAHLLASNLRPKRLEEPLDVPECLSSHLTTCHYKGFDGKEEEMELVRQILKAAKVLKSMKTTVAGYLDSKKLCVCKELRKFQRSSQNCEIAFDEGRFT